MNEDNQTQKSFPTIGLKLTGKCNLNCKFCCEPQRDQPVYQLESFFKIIDLLKNDFGTNRICLTGGDPLLYKDIEHVASYAQEKGFYVLLLTSDGKELVNKADTILPAVDSVRLSVHGVGACHDKIVRRKGAFSDIDNAAKFLVQSKKRLMITTVITPETIDHVEEIANWACQHTVTDYYFFGLMKSGQGKRYVDNYGDIDSSKVERIKAKFLNKYKKKMNIVYYDYKSKAECILVYGDGRILIDPYPGGQNHQKILGNIFSDKPSIIFDNFNEDAENRYSYKKHCDNISLI